MSQETFEERNKRYSHLPQITEENVAIYRAHRKSCEVCRVATAPTEDRLCREGWILLRIAVP